MAVNEIREKTLRIGNVELENPFLLAPLAGITDAPMRRIAREMGAALTYSEMVSGKGLMYGDKNTERLLTIYDDEKPVAYQIFGCEPEVIEYTARALAARGNAVLDINMGCPVPKIVKNGEGSALMKNPDLVYDVVCAAVRGAKRGAEEIGAAPKPITVKTRIGFTADTLNAVEVAKAAEAAGAAAVAVHGRTREQYYSGKADWGEIAKVKAAVRVPVIGNGTSSRGEDALGNHGRNRVRFRHDCPRRPRKSLDFPRCACALQRRRKTGGSVCRGAHKNAYAPLRRPPRLQRRVCRRPRNAQASRLVSQRHPRLGRRSPPRKQHYRSRCNAIGICRNAELLI